MANRVLLFQACNLCFQSLSFLVTLLLLAGLGGNFQGCPIAICHTMCLAFQFSLIFIDLPSLDFHRFHIGFMVFMVQELYVRARFMCLMLEQIYYFDRFTTDSTILLLLKNTIVLRDKLVMKNFMITPGSSTSQMEQRSSDHIVPDVNDDNIDNGQCHHFSIR